MTDYSVVVLARGSRRMRSGRDVPSTGNSDLLPHFEAEEEKHDHVLTKINLGKEQVWSLAQFYSVDFLKSRIDVKKCVFNKRTINVCVSCG